MSSAYNDQPCMNAQCTQICWDDEFLTNDEGFQCNYKDFRCNDEFVSVMMRWDQYSNDSLLQ